MPDEFDVVIVGGGVAMAHADGDARVLLVEQTLKSGAINRGDLIWPPHLELLERWGALPELLRRDPLRLQHNELRDNAGRLLLRHDLSFFRSTHSAALVLEHPEIEESLLQAAARHPRLTVWRGARFAGLADQDGDGVIVHLLRQGIRVAVRAAWVVAADGRQSQVRAAAGIHSPMTPYPYEILMLRIPGPSPWPGTAEQFAGEAGFLGLFLVNGENSRLALPLPTGAVPTFIQSPEADRRMEIARRAAPLADLPVLWDPLHSYKLFAHHAPSYHRGRVVLVGDAAHTFTPLLGMGMNLALEDAAALAPLLAHRRHREALDNRVLDECYAQRRRRRNRHIIDQSNLQGSLQVSGAPWQRWAFRLACQALQRLPALQTAALRYSFA